MKRVTIAFCVAAFLISCGETKTSDNTAGTNTGDTSSTATSTSTSSSEAWVPVDSATAMKTMMEVGTPGEEHKMLATANGTWDAEMTMWMSEGGTPMVSKAVCTNKMLYGNRYQQGSFKGDFGGMPFEGTSTTGYDKGEKVWWTTWMDNMSTGMMQMKGTWDDATKTVNYKGKMYCAANGKWCDMRETFKIVDDNHQVMEMYGPDMKTGKEYKSMEIKFTRK